MKQFQIRQITRDDRAWVAALLKEWWAGPKIVTRGKVHYADKLPGFIAVKEGKPAGLVTYNIVGKDCEIVTMNSLIEKTGMGSALIDAVKNAAVSEGCQRLWLITTNDNTHALRFYQKYGLTLAAVHRNAIEQSRRLKPEIPLTGNDGIPIRDEIELEMLL
ncbi:MAG: GNAT family N-acetyltransferase [Chloroflexi bacterium RBG_16_50_11]|nr:MAG: GNAT family N-acetyltransferase [Chloroflexi bacterium RBG_16_50_11]